MFLCFEITTEKNMLFVLLFYACRTENVSLHREYAYTSFIYLHIAFQPMKFRARFPSNFSSNA